MTANLTLYRILSGAPGCAMWPGALLVCFALLGCASGPNANPRDPLEPFNRGVYQLNEKVDAAVLKPVATVYRDLTPVRVRQGIGNFFGNLEDVWSLVNNLLQLRGQAAIDSLKRIGVNTFIGWGGVFDVATEMDIEKHTKDFGHTLGYWGVAPGPYLVLPLLGPSTLRDTVALPVDWSGDMVSNIPHVPTRNTATVLRAVDTRSDLLKAGTMLEEAALDRYTFIRDAFLQRRRNVIYDGNPPEEELADTASSQVEMKQLKPEALIETTGNMPTRTLDETLNTAGLAGDEKAKP
jgi:phospholipid-binding lipoprotein MlaA